MHVICTDDTVLRGGTSWLFIIEHTTRWGPVARTLRLPPMVWCVELGYRVVASNRVFFSRFFYRDE